jgi:[ribosomal protein S5]-alanine N-acetyltransferase
MRDEATEEQRQHVMRSATLTYRPLDATDAGRVAVLAGEWDIARMTSRIPHPYSLVDADLWIASIGNDEFVRGVEHEGALIGAIGYIEGKDRQAEIGYWIGKPWWGHGFATEAAQTLVAHCFGPAGFSRLTCGHFIDNPASARVIAKLGFRRVGNGRQWCEARKSEVDTVRYMRRRPLLAVWRSGAA